MGAGPRAAGLGVGLHWRGTAPRGKRPAPGLRRAPLPRQLGRSRSPPGTGACGSPADAAAARPLRRSWLEPGPRATSSPVGRWPSASVSPAAAGERCDGMLKGFRCRLGLPRGLQRRPSTRSGGSVRPPRKGALGEYRGCVPIQSMPPGPTQGRVTRSETHSLKAATEQFKSSHTGTQSIHDPPYPADAVHTPLDRSNRARPSHIDRESALRHLQGSGGTAEGLLDRAQGSAAPPAGGPTHGVVRACLGTFSGAARPA